ncbi:hypothetical protein [Sulfobacillus thermosulfidooxidans]|uniref:hypothetical protein n=1 Tax=Sulfobacillus thermosulfidooxidans TaxID=28034 RepID=UPI0006B46D39|nr:hypothetical protein [Sulfobacillus thermosulfidooxidans]
MAHPMTLTADFINTQSVDSSHGYLHVRVFWGIIKNSMIQNGDIVFSGGASLSGLLFVGEYESEPEDNDGELFCTTSPYVAFRTVDFTARYGPRSGVSEELFFADHTIDETIFQQVYKASHLSRTTVVSLS